MFKSVFTKYVISIVLIFALSFLFFAVIAMSYVSEFASEDTAEGVQTVSRSAKVIVDQLYEHYFEKNDNCTYTSFLENEKSTVKSALNQVAVIKGVEILIIDKDDLVMLSTEKKLLDQEIPEEFYKNEGVFEKEEREFKSDGKISIGGLLEKKCFVSAIKLSGNEKFYVLTYNSVDSDSILISKMTKFIFASFLVVFLLGGSVCYIISNRIIAPLKQMSEASRAFAKGNFKVRVDVHGKDEIADLAIAFNNMAASLGELEEQRSEFLSNVSHDLRTPMTSISGFIDGILDGTIPKEQQEHYLGIVNTEIKRLSRLVRTLLEVTKIEAGARKFNMVDFDVAQMAITILFTFEKQIENKRINVDIDSDDRAYVKADMDAIHQVLYNLIDNAVKFTFEDGDLRISIKNLEKTVHVEIYNQGCGIAQADLNHVFDRFFKADKSRGMDKSGAGLGLFIVKTIVQAHGGRIEAESEEGKYCTFKLDLPIGTVPAAERKKNR